MAARATQVQARYRRAVLRSLVRRPHHQHLIHRKFGVMPVTAGHAVILLKVGRRQELAMSNLFTESRCVLSNRVDGPFADRITSSIGPSSLESIRYIHDVRRQHVLPRRRQRRVVQARNYNFHHWFCRTLAILGVVIGELDGVQIRCNDHAAIGLLEPVEFRQPIECEVQFRDITVAAQSSNTVREADIEVLDANQVQEGSLRVSRRDDVIRLDFFAVGQLHAACFQSIGAAVNQNTVDRGSASDHDTRVGGRHAQSRNQAVNATRRNNVSALGFAGHAIQHREDGAIGGTRRQFRTDEPVPAQRSLKDVIVEKFIHQVTGWKRGNPQKFPHVALAKRPDVQSHTPKCQQVGHVHAADTRHRFEPGWLQRIGKTVHEPNIFLVAFHVVGAGPAHRVLLQDDMILAGT